MVRSYPHMCRNEHPEIGHRDSEHEQCPLCRAIGALRAIEELTDQEIEVRYRTHPYKSEEQVAGKSAVYSLLSVPRNIARQALATLKD